MIIAAQGTSGAGKTTAFVTLEQRLPSATYVPETVLSTGPYDDTFFVRNDVAKSELASSTTEAIALVDRDFTSTLAVIAARDGFNAESYIEAEKAVRELIEMGRLAIADTYFLFYVPMEVSVARQSPSNHPMWRDHAFVKKYDQALDEIRPRFVDDSSVIRIDGTETPEAVSDFCLKGILANMEFKKNEVLLDRPFIELEEPEERLLVDFGPFTDTAMVVLKPDALSRGIEAALLREIEEEGFEIVVKKTKVLNEKEILHLWPKFWTESWWRDAVEYMTSGESVALLCRRSDLSGQQVHDALLELKRRIREKYRDKNEQRPQVSIVHTSQDHKEFRMNVHAFWSAEELNEVEATNE